MPDNLFTRFTQAAADPDRVFLKIPGRPSLSFRQTFALAARFAHVLARHGVVAGDRVAVQVEKNAPALCLYLACLRLGAVYLPLNTGYTPTEIAYFVGDAEPRVLVCSPRNRERLAALPCPLLTLGDDGTTGSLAEQSADATNDFPDADVGMSDLASILYTSGTTGRSKGAMLSHGNLLANAAALKQAWHYSDGDVLLHALPIFHTHGLFVATNVSLLSAAAIILLPKFDPDMILRHLPEATVMMGVPTFYVRLLQDPRLTREAAQHIRLFISGSAPLSADTHREWSERSGHAILERYGMTETNMNTSNPYEGRRLPGSVGFALPGVELRIADADGRALPQGEIGMIEVRGPSVFSGYWRMPERNDTEFRPDGFFITGDLGTVDSGGYVHIVGRAKDLIITGGFNVYPKEIESLIDELPGVTESAVVGLPHGDFGEGVTAFVVARDVISEAEILAALGERLARFKLPKRVIFVEQLPRNTMGKVQKGLMRQEYAGLYA